MLKNFEKPSKMSKNRGKKNRNSKNVEGIEKPSKNR